MLSKNPGVSCSCAWLLKKLFVSPSTCITTKVFIWFASSYLPLSPIFLTILVAAFCFASCFFSAFAFDFDSFGLSTLEDLLSDPSSDFVSETFVSDSGFGSLGSAVDSLVPPFSVVSGLVSGPAELATLSLISLFISISISTSTFCSDV